MTGIKLLAYREAPEQLFSDGKEKMRDLFPDLQFEYNSPDPAILVFLSGGSESEATRIVRPGNFYILAAFEENNSFAAATEVKAWMDREGIGNMLVDLWEDHDRKTITLLTQTLEALQQLQGKQLGLIGGVSEWLLASDTGASNLKNKLGIAFKKIPWDDIADFRSQTPETTILDKFDNFNEQKIREAAQVHAALKQTINSESLDAVTVECFSLVRKHKVTACLSLSQFNDEGLPAGCEGDLVSITGMMLVQALTGRIPWMANLIRVSFDCVRFAHCTAPVSLLDNFSIQTHYETGEGTAVAGTFAGEEITVFRLNAELNKAFIAEGNIISTHQSPHACRTQIEVNLPKDAVYLLKNHPLGNHHLVIPGQHAGQLQMACALKGIEILD